MVTAAILTVLVHLITAVLSIIPIPGPPDWLSGNSGAVATVFADAGHLGAWFPASLVLTVVLAVAAINIVGFAVKLARIAASFLTLGGGGAG